MKYLRRLRPRAVCSASAVFTGLLTLIFLTLPALANAADSAETALGQALVANKWSWAKGDGKGSVWRTTLTFHQDGTITNPTDHHTWFWWVIDEKTAHIQFHPEPGSPSTPNLQAGMNLVFTDDLKNYRGIYIPDPKSPIASGQRKGPTGEVIPAERVRLARADAAAVAPGSAPGAPNATPSPDHTFVEILSEQAPNSLEWALAPLDRTTPRDVRQNLTYLREDLLDEAAKKPAAGADAYKLGQQLCDDLIATLDERDKALVRAGYTSAQAQANIVVTSQALEARRNYMMSWPQYKREQAQRREIQKEQDAHAALTKERPVVEWANRGAQIRTMVDSLYAQYREAVRRSAAPK
jgi:hypothetical protein